MNRLPTVSALVLLAGLALPAQAQNGRIDNRVDTRTRPPATGQGTGSQNPPPADPRTPGDGHALDRNLRVGSDGRTEVVRDFDAMRRFNDAVIYGQASGGKSFRDTSVESRDPFAFRGTLSTDDIYRFRRDTAAAALIGQGLRASDALSYQVALTTGRPVAPPISLALIPERIGNAASGASLSSARSVAQFQWEQSRRPSVLGYASERGGKGRVLTASPLRGVATSFIADAEGDSTLTGMERSPLGVVRPGEINDRMANSPMRTRIDTRMPSAYDDVMGRLRGEGGYGDQPGPDGKPQTAPGGAASPGAAAPTKPAWERDLDELRSRMRAKPALPTEPPAARPMPGATPPPDDEAKLEAESDERARKTVDLLKRLKKQAAVKDLAGETRQDMSLYANVLAEGQSLLQSGRYLDAEGVFSRLLVSYPGDPMASVGRVHAQIGAGAYISAAASLRSIYTVHPELIPSRYAGRALMPEDRLRDVAQHLGQRVAQADSVIGPDAALLLAYLGFQADNREWLQVGLDGLRRSGTADVPEAALTKTLIEVWSVEAAPPVEPSK